MRRFGVEAGVFFTDLSLAVISLTLAAAYKYFPYLQGFLDVRSFGSTWASVSTGESKRPMHVTSLLYLNSTRRMALPLAKQTTKLMCQLIPSILRSHRTDSPVAPVGSVTNSQAGQYTKDALDRSQLLSDPLAQFNKWFSHAQASGVLQPETVCLSTASLPSGRVSSRFVYLKELDTQGFVIYSNWGTSQKAKDVSSNPWASLAFWWGPLERQVRVEGRVERLTQEESQVYYDTRIRGSRIGAWASKQSQTIEGREELEGWVKETEKKFEGQDKIPVPEFWGGLRVIPERIEFWQGRESRLHDRFIYDKVEGQDQWEIKRLSP